MFYIVLRRILNKILSLNIIIEFFKEMDIVNLQPQMYKALFNIASKRNNFQQLNKLIETVWKQPEMLNDSFKIFCNKNADLKNHNVDLASLVLFYQDMINNITLLPDGFMGFYNFFFTALEMENDWLNYFKQENYSRLRVFLIVLFWPPLFKTQIRTSNVLKLFRLLQRFSREQLHHLASWLKDMEAERFQETVKFLQVSLSKQIVKLLPGEFDKHDSMEVSDCIMLLCKGLELFSMSNNANQKIQKELFRNQDVLKYFAHNDQFNLHIRKIGMLNFIQFPFLFDLNYKNKLLEIQNHFQHQQTIERGLLDLLNRPIESAQQIIIDQATIKSFYLQLQINRTNILDDSVNQITNTSLSLKNPLKISFVGQMGDDAGGVKKQYFQLLIKQIFNENSDMFRTINNNAFYWFNGLSYEPTIMFEFVGIILGLSIYNNTLLDMKFPRLIYKKLILADDNQLDCLEELGEIDPYLQKSLKYILETNEPLQPMELTFEASVVQFGQIMYFDIKPNGSLIQLTQKNKHQYVSKMAEWVVNKQIQKQFKAFKQGFYRVVTGDMIRLFSAEELEKIICGSNIIDIHELRKGSRYGGGFRPDTPIILQLWEILHEFTYEQRKAFLFFATGSDRTPVGGLSSLKFIVQRYTTDSQMLPNSRTCSNLLLLPEYSSKQKLKQKLLLAMEHKEGFGLI